MNNNSNDELINIVNKFFQIISGSSNQSRDWQSFKNLFSSDAILSASVKNMSNEYVLHSWSVDSYIERLDNFLKANDFYEKAENFNIVLSKNIPQLTCNYFASRNKSFSPELKRGLNHIHFIKKDGEWKIINSIWEDN